MTTEAEVFIKENGVDIAKMHGYQTYDYDKCRKIIDLRYEFISNFGFAVLTETVIKAIAPYAPLLEIGCGSGYWAYELRKAKIDIVPTDPGTSKYLMTGKIYGRWAKLWLEIEKIDGVRAVEKYPNRNLLTVWPDYDTDWPAQTLRKFKGQTVLYVGEGHGGCTANNDFHDLLESKYRQIQDIAIPQFDGLHDRLEIWNRR